MLLQVKSLRYLKRKFADNIKNEEIEPLPEGEEEEWGKILTEEFKLISPEELKDDN